MNKKGDEEMDELIWIRTSDRMPDDDDPKAVTCENKKGERIWNRAWWDEANGEWHGQGSMSNIIAWADVQPYEGGLT